MEKKIEEFYELVKTEMTMSLATAEGASVTMRLVSPAYMEGGILIFTDSASVKFAQLKANPSCAVSLGGFFAEATAEFMGPCMDSKNAKLREVYSEKFPYAFAEGVAFGGRNAEFILLKPFKLSGWAFENDIPTPDGIPSIPFSVAL